MLSPPKAFDVEITPLLVLDALATDAYRAPVGDSYGVRFHNRWRTRTHNQRQVYRYLHRKGETWDPPGYPASWD